MPSSMPSSVVAVSCEPSLAEMSAALSAFAKCCVRAALLAPPATPAHAGQHDTAPWLRGGRTELRTCKAWKSFAAGNTPVMLRATLARDAKGRNRAGTTGDSSSSANPARRHVKHRASSAATTDGMARTAAHPRCSGSPRRAATAWRRRRRWTLEGRRTARRPPCPSCHAGKTGTPLRVTSPPAGGHQIAFDSGQRSKQDPGPTARRYGARHGDATKQQLRITLTAGLIVSKPCGRSRRRRGSLATSACLARRSRWPVGHGHHMYAAGLSRGPVRQEQNLLRRQIIRQTGQFICQMQHLGCIPDVEGKIVRADAVWEASRQERFCQSANCSIARRALDWWLREDNGLSVWS